MDAEGPAASRIAGQPTLPADAGIFLPKTAMRLGTTAVFGFGGNGWTPRVATWQWQPDSRGGLRPYRRQASGEAAS